MSTLTKGKSSAYFFYNVEHVKFLPIKSLSIITFRQVILKEAKGLGVPLYRTMFGMWTIYNYHFTSCNNSTKEAYYKHDVKAIGLSLPSRAVIAV